MKKLAALLVLGLVLSACYQSSTDEAAHLTFMAGFSAQANLPFVGVYVADALGYFEEEGLVVTIEHSGGGGEHLQLLASGEVDVTTQDAAVLLQRRADPGLPLVSIGLIGQTGQQAFVSLADSGIETPADWVGKTVGFKGTPPPDVFAILEANGVSAEEIELVDVGFDPRVLVQGQVDVYPVFRSNEPDVLDGLGYPTVMWSAADYGMPTLGLAYVSSEELIESRHDDLAGFMNAALRGIEYARANPEEAINIVLTHMGDGADADHQRFILDVELADALGPATDEFGVGWQTTEQWQALADYLLEYGTVESAIDTDGAFTIDLLP